MLTGPCPGARRRRPKPDAVGTARGSIVRNLLHPYNERIGRDGGQVNGSVTGQGKQIVVLLSGDDTASPVPDVTPLISGLDDASTVLVI